MSNAEIRGRFVWHELMTTDTGAASDFYSRIVPWKAEDSGMPSYSLWMSGKTRAGGLMAQPEADGTPPHWIIYIATPDVDATVAAAEKLGGRILKPAADIPNVGRFAVLSDPQGAAFALFTPGSEPEGEMGGGGVGDFTWHELATTDPEAALSFYSELFGWSKGATHDMGDMVYYLISHEGKDVGGVYKARDNSTPPNWLSYVRVADAAKAANAVKAAGGRVLNGPIEVPGGSWIVQILDPQGGAIALVEASAAASGAGESGSEPRKKAAKKVAKKAAAASAPAKAPAKAPPAKSAPAKAVGKAAKKAAKKAGKPAKKAVKKVAKKAAKKGAAKPAAKKAAKKASKPKAKAKSKAARKK
jgi:predicted enzyme related to lactoylglutathione lyase